MGTFVNTNTGVQVSVDDSKDDRFVGDLWESGDEKPKKATAKKASSSKSS